MITSYGPIRAARRKTGSPFSLRHAVCVLAALVATFGRAQPLDAIAPELASGFGPVREAAANRFMAVTANPHATAAAVEVMGRGGNALDAAIAAQMVLGVVEPQSSGLGGGAFLLLREPGGGLRAYDGRETAPRRASSDFFRDAEGKPVPFVRLVGDGRSVGVPGLVPLLELAHRRHGRLPWARLFDDAIRLAEDGFAVSPRLHRSLREDPLLRNDPAAARLFYPVGRPLEAGAILRNPELASVLRAVAQEGSAALQRGPVAEAMVAAAAARGGVLEMDDLASYQAVERDPVCGAFRRWRVCGMPPPSSGGIAVLQILGIADRAHERAGLDGSVIRDHLLAEAGRLAFADRARYVGDPAYVPVPAAGLVSSPYLDRRAGLIDASRAMPRGPVAPGELIPGLSLGEGMDHALPATTHLSVVDADDGAVALTSSIESGFGSRIFVKGFLLNNQLTDFSPGPADALPPVANALQPGKRPMSAMSPTLVLDEHGDVVAVAGSAGGPRIINQTARSIWMLLAEGMSPAVVVAAPHAGNRNGATEIERDRYPAEAANRLRVLGHEVKAETTTSGLHLIVRRDGRWLGAADPRREGRAEGR